MRKPGGEMKYTKTGLISVSTGSEIVECRLTELLELKQERDHWKQAYCKAEQEAARLEAWATKLYREVQELRKK